MRGGRGGRRRRAGALRAGGGAQGGGAGGRRRLCGPGGEGGVERPGLRGARLVEPSLEPLLQGIADVGAAAGAAFHDEVPKIRRNDAGSHRRKRAVLPGSTRHRHGLRRRGEAGSSTAEPNSADAAHGQDIR